MFPHCPVLHTCAVETQLVGRCIDLCEQPSKLEFSQIPNRSKLGDPGKVYGSFPRENSSQYHLQVDILSIVIRADLIYDLRWYLALVQKF